MKTTPSNTVTSLIRAVECEPDEYTPQGMLYDALQEDGATPLSARRRVNTIVRVAQAQDLLDYCGTTAAGRYIRREIRRAMGIDECVPLDEPFGFVVESGNMEPYMRFESDSKYSPADLRVGEGWIREQLRQVCVGRQWLRDRQQRARARALRR